MRVRAVQGSTDAPLARPRRPVTTGLRYLLFTGLALSSMALVSSLFIPSHDAQAGALRAAISALLVLMGISLWGLGRRPVLLWPFQVLAVVIGFAVPPATLVLLFCSLVAMREEHFFRGSRQPDSILPSRMPAAWLAYGRVVLVFACLAAAPFLAMYVDLPGVMASLMSCTIRGTTVDCHGGSGEGFVGLLMAYSSWGMLVIPITVLPVFLFAMFSTWYRRQTVAKAARFAQAVPPNVPVSGRAP